MRVYYDVVVSCCGETLIVAVAFGVLLAQCKVRLMGILFIGFRDVNKTQPIHIPAAIYLYNWHHLEAQNCS